MAAKPKAGPSFVKSETVPKKTSDGASKNTRYKSKNDKLNKKLYRGQGR
jgi:hypothetical protein